MTYTVFLFLSTLGLFLGMLLLLEAGRRIGARRKVRDREGVAVGVGVVEGAVFSLLGLLMAFSFSGASARFDGRRHLIIQETNAIGTAYLRLDLLRAEARVKLQESFRQYVKARLLVYEKISNKMAGEELAIATKLQGDIWSQAVAACREAETPQTAGLLLPALNEMIDITTIRTWTTQLHPPEVVFVMLFGLALASSLLAGYNMAEAKSRRGMHMLTFAVTVALAIYVILDFEFPRLGFIRVDAFDRALVELLESMK
jgi:hypothetical protein